MLTHGDISYFYSLNMTETPSLADCWNLAGAAGITREASTSGRRT
jgi:hypothetical protein